MALISEAAERLIRTSWPPAGCVPWACCTCSLGSRPFSLPDVRNPPRPLLVAGPSSAGSRDSDGGLFAVPTTLPPNSRHGKLFSPSKDAELSFRQHLNSISVSAPARTLAPPAGTSPSRPPLFALQMQSDFFLPKPRKLRKRHLRKPLVVQVSAAWAPAGAGLARTHWFSWGQTRRNRPPPLD